MSDEIVEGKDGKLEIVKADLYLTRITPNDDTGTGSNTAFRTVEDAKAQAEEWHLHDGSEDPEDNPLKWKDPPQAWQPDAVAVTQYFDDGVEENPVG